MLLYHVYPLSKNVVGPIFDHGGMEKSPLPLCDYIPGTRTRVEGGGNEIKEQLKKTGEKSRECAQGHKRDSLTIDREQWWKWQL